MTSYVNFCFGTEGSDVVTSLWKTLADQDISHFGAWLNYPPHFSAVRVDDAEPQLLVPAAKRLAETIGRLEIWLASVSFFGGPEAVMFLSHVPNALFIDAHQKLCRDLAPLRIHPLYDAGSWMPHVTLAVDLNQDKAVAATSAIVPTFKPFPVTLTRVEVVSFPPAQVIWSGEIVA